MVDCKPPTSVAEGIDESEASGPPVLLISSLLPLLLLLLLSMLSLPLILLLLLLLSFARTAFIMSTLESEALTPCALAKA